MVQIIGSSQPGYIICFAISYDFAAWSRISCELFTKMRSRYQPEMNQCDELQRSFSEVKLRFTVLVQEVQQPTCENSFIALNFIVDISRQASKRNIGPTFPLPFPWFVSSKPGSWSKNKIKSIFREGIDTVLSSSTNWRDLGTASGTVVENDGIFKVMLIVRLGHQFEVALKRQSMAVVQLIEWPF